MKGVEQLLPRAEVERAEGPQDAHPVPLLVGGRAPEHVVCDGVQQLAWVMAQRSATVQHVADSLRPRQGPISVGLGAFTWHGTSYTGNATVFDMEHADSAEPTDMMTLTERAGYA